MTSIITSTALIHHRSIKHTKILPENVNCNNGLFSWKILANRKPSCPVVSYYISKVRYLASSFDNTAVVYMESFNGGLMSQPAYFISENIVYVIEIIESTIFPGRELTIPLVLFRNPTIYSIMEDNSCTKLRFTTYQLASYLYCIDENALTKKMLQLDGCYITLDRFIIAMGFVYLIRIGFNPADFNATSVIAACLIAHKMEEDLYPGLGFMDVFKNSLPSHMSGIEKNAAQRQVIDAHTVILKNLSFRCWVDQKVCLQVMEASPNHPVWRRSRLGFHSGAVTHSYYLWKLNCLERAVGLGTSNAPTQLCSVETSCCIMCLGNPRYSTNIKDRFCNSSTQLQQTTALCSVLMNSWSLSPDYASSSSSPEFHSTLDIQRSLRKGVKDKESLEYLKALSKENEIEEILLKGKRLYDLQISATIVD